MTAAAKDIFKVLVKLDKRDLRQIKDRAEYLMKNSSDEKSCREIDLFYDSICNKIYSLIRVRQPNLGVHKKMHKKLCEKINIVRDSIDSYLKELLKPERVTKVMLQRWYIIYCELICEYIVNHTNLPLTVSEILDNEDKFPELLDDAYPSYIENSLIHLILK